MAKLNNNNGTVNFGFAGNGQTGTAAVVVRSRQTKMRSDTRIHTGKPLSQPHYLTLAPSISMDSRESLERSDAADTCLSAAAAGPCWPAAELPPAAWASLVICRAITL